MLTIKKTISLAMFVTSFLVVSSMPLMADGTTFSCTPCSTQASPPYFEGPASYSVINETTRKVEIVKTFNSLSSCQQAWSFDYYCTHRPPVSTDH